MGSNGDLRRLCPETLHPCFGSNLIRTFFASLCEPFQVESVANFPRVSSGRPYISVGIAEVFHTPVAPSFDVLLIVETRKARLSNSNTKGKTSQAQLILMKLFMLYASPVTIIPSVEERITFVIVRAIFSKCSDRLFGACHGLWGSFLVNVSKNLNTGSADG